MSTSDFVWFILTPLSLVKHIFSHFGLFNHFLGHSDAFWRLLALTMAKKSVKDYRLEAAAKAKGSDAPCARCLDHWSSSGEPDECRFGEDMEVLEEFKVGNVQYNRCLRCLKLNSVCMKVSLSQYGAFWRGLADIAPSRPLVCSARPLASLVGSASSSRTRGTPKRTRRSILRTLRLFTRSLARLLLFWARRSHYGSVWRSLG